MKSLVNNFHAYRAHVVLLFGALLALHLAYFRVDLLENLPVVIAFISLLAGAYVANRYFDIAEDRITQPEEARGDTGVLITSAVLFTGPLILLLALRQPALPYLVVALLCIAYSSPLPFLAVRVKEVPIVKNVYAAFVWHLIVLVVVAAYALPEHTLLGALAVAPGLFFVVWFFELIWDVRDVEGDRATGVHTVPVLFGLTITKIALLGLLLLWWFVVDLPANPLFLVNLAYLALAAALIRPGYPRMFYHALIYVQLAFTLANLLLYVEYF